MTFLTTNAVGGSISTDYTLDIACNYLEHDRTWLSSDDWVPDIERDAAALKYEGGGVSYFRMPSHAGSYATGNSRSLPRHNKQCNFRVYRRARAGTTGNPKPY
jgi:hypothetical protein